MAGDLGRSSKTYTDMQKDLLQRFDQQPEIGNKLWPVNQASLDRKDWPQYYIGSYPYCFRLPKFPEVVPTPPLKGGAGMREMEAHQGIAALSVTEQGGPLKMGQSPGTHWYHAHKHGSTTIDVSNGFAGAFIIEGQYDDEINEVYKAYAENGRARSRCWSSTSSAPRLISRAAQGRIKAPTSLSMAVRIRSSA